MTKWNVCNNVFTLCSCEMTSIILKYERSQVNIYVFVNVMFKTWLDDHDVRHKRKGLKWNIKHNFDIC